MNALLICLASLALTCAPSLASAQAATAPSPTQLTVQVVIVKMQGEKKVSSVPYTLSVVANSGGRSSLRLGTRIPLAHVIQTGEKPVTTYNYSDLGVGIDCGAVTVLEGRYRLDLTVEDTSVQADPAPGAASAAPQTFRSFKVSEFILLRDGQSAQFTAATDKFTGEVTRVEVSLAVVK